MLETPKLAEEEVKGEGIDEDAVVKIFKFYDHKRIVQGAYDYFIPLATESQRQLIEEYYFAAMECVYDELTEEEAEPEIDNNSDFEMAATLNIDSNTFMRNTQPLEPTIPLGES